VLSHRLGLVPLAIDPTKISWKTVDEGANERNTVVFKLSVHCKHGSDGDMVNDKGE
jgi:hypothetical protein